MRNVINVLGIRQSKIPHSKRLYVVLHSERWARRVTQLLSGGFSVRGRFKNTYELLNLGALKSSLLNKLHTFQYMDKIFYVEFQRKPLKFHTKYLTHTLKDTNFIPSCQFMRSHNYNLLYASETPPPPPPPQIRICYSNHAD